MRGSILVNFNDTVDDSAQDFFVVLVNNNQRIRQRSNTNKVYCTYVFSGDTVAFQIQKAALNRNNVTVTRIDYTTDDVAGDRGIKNTNVSFSVSADTSTNYIITFPVTGISSAAYDFNYLISGVTTPPCLNIGTGFGDKTWQSKTLVDGSIFVGGDFTTYNGTSVNRLAKLNYDGSLNTGFTVGTGPNNRVRVVELETPNSNSTKIYIGGDFTSYSGVSRNSIARINSDGSLDTSFVVGTGFNDVLYEIGLDLTKVLCCGNFTSYSGTSINRIARLNSDGSLDTTFNVGTGANLEVNDVVRLSSGRILIGGSFTTYNGTSVGRFVRLNNNGTIDTSFTGLTTGFDNTIYVITIQSDAKIIVSGAFTTFNSISRPGIVRLNSDGSYDSTFTPLTSINGFIYGQVVQSDGKIIIVGNFTTINGQSRSGIARLNIDGTLDTTYNIGSGFTMTDIVEDIQFVRLSNLTVITGGYTAYNGVSANRIIRLNEDGTSDLC